MMRPEIVCLCGSTRFTEAFRRANFEETLAGRIVLSVGCDTKSDEGLEFSAEQKEALDVLHLRKIELADRVHVLNVGGYIGDSTARELGFACLQPAKRITFLDSAAGDAFMELHRRRLGRLGVEAIDLVAMDAGRRAGG